MALWMMNGVIMRNRMDGNLYSDVIPNRHPKLVAHLHEDLLLKALVIDDCRVCRYESDTITVSI